jgi:hypothetical protein
VLAFIQSRVRDAKVDRVGVADRSTSGDDDQR